jgi:hypothetical protein
MKIKLNHTEFETLLAAIEERIEIIYKLLPSHICQKALVAHCLLSLYNKIFKKRTLFKKAQYFISIEPHEAIAFFILFADVSHSNIYVNNLIAQLRNNIFQKLQLPKL